MNYDELYKQYYKKISRYLAAIVGESEAEDLAQEVFLKVGSKLGSLKDDSKVSSWIFKIALNAARDRLREPFIKNPSGRACFSEAKTEIDAVEQLEDIRSRTPEERLVRREMIQCYLDFVSELPKNYYDVYVLSEFERLPDKAISKRLSIPLETAKIRLHRARVRLYDQLRRNCRCYYNDRGELMGTLK